jgi:nucleotide-binding universal stress UspA family protein
MFKHILIAVDVDDPASWKSSLPVAQAMARCFSGRLTLCSVLADQEAFASGAWWPLSYEDELAKRHAALDEIASRMDGDVATSLEVGFGTISSGIADVAERVGADLVVLSSKQQQIANFLTSGIGQRTAAKTACSILLLRT